MGVRAKILIVDDDPDFVESLRIFLGGHSYEVISALTGQEALEKAEKGHPDLIILDMMMAAIDEGLDLSKRWRGDPRYANVPILMLTALRKGAGFDLSDAAGSDLLPVDDYVHKPVEPEDLLHRVEKLLMHHRVQRAGTVDRVSV